MQSKPTETQQPCTQRQLDEMAFEMYVDCGRSLSETSRQMSVAPSTLRGRINRHSRRLSAEEYAARQRGLQVCASCRMDSCGGECVR